MFSLRLTYFTRENPDNHTINTNSTRKLYDNLSKEDLKDAMINLVDSIPSDAQNIRIEAYRYTQEEEYF